ncbi:imidazole glycerol phosphate synthase subunit HisH [Ekhidna sp.]|uniref:imidazole glycerol phosphate synthase subunit HisH n=1 Tax=Ekhidna sp. TaxID=2608089 RepID=UPI003B505EC5
MITILDYGVGNLGSIKNMLKKLGYTSEIVSDKQKISLSEKFILPGVGSFDNCMVRLRNAPFFETFQKKVLQEKVNVLGICVGFQMLFDSSEEGKQPGLGWIKGKVVKFDATKLLPSLKIPHMGWTDVNIHKSSKLFSGLVEDPRFYFVHSYHAIDTVEEEAFLTCKYGYEFVCGVELGNIMGVQFHPEKSHTFGMQLLSNFASNY